MTISPYTPSAVTGPFFDRDPGPNDTAFPRGYYWIAITGNQRRLWVCFEDGANPEWMLLSVSRE